MRSTSHYSTCRENWSRFSHQNSRTRLLSTGTSVSSDDAVFPEEAASVELSVRSGSDQGQMSAASFCSRPLAAPGMDVACPRRASFQGQQPHRVPASRRLSAQLQERPLPSIPPTLYDNVGHDGQVQNQTTRPAACSSHVPLPAKAHKSKNIKCTKFQCVSILALCLLSVLASSLSVYTYVTACDYNKDYCLPCSDLTQAPTTNSQRSLDMNYQLTRKEVDGQKLCCVNSSDGLALLVAQVQHNERMNHVVSQNMTSAHVGLYADDKAESEAERPYYTLLISPVPSLQHLQNVDNDQTTLSIIVTGRYFVYSSIHFNLEEYPRACRELTYKTWVHQVYVNRGARGDTTAILRSEHTCCLECKEERTSGFTGGVFELLAGDHVFVDVSAPPWVIDTKQTSYLGLFLIDKQ